MWPVTLRNAPVAIRCTSSRPKTPRTSPACRRTWVGRASSTKRARTTALRSPANRSSALLPARPWCMKSWFACWMTTAGSSPGGFLPTAERFGLSLDIDRWVITHAIETLAEQRKTLPELCYTINLSRQTLNTPAICDLIHHKLRATGTDPAALIFEVTETVAITDLTAAATLLARLRALGCPPALDRL